jgi:DNA polymerase-3 subunit epsilon
MRQIVLDTETTGLEPTRGHRIIEIGCVELLNRRPTGRALHHYLDPGRDIEEAARAVHGITREQLEGRPKFQDIARELTDFLAGSELIIHNAAFDVAFLELEFALLNSSNPVKVRELCRVLDTLSLARERHPGQRNSLDALCKRYEVDNSHRELHGALLDARLLADVYLAMTGGQSTLALDQAGGARVETLAVVSITPLRPAVPLRVIAASAAERAAHAGLIELLHKASGGRCLWRLHAETGEGPLAVAAGAT